MVLLLISRDVIRCSSVKTRNIVKANPHIHICILAYCLDSITRRHNAGNEAADSLAKQAHYIQKKTHVEIMSSLQQGYDIAKLTANTQWQSLYDSSDNPAHHKLLETKVSRYMKYSHKNKQIERTISRLRLGHCLVNTSLHQFGPRQTGDWANYPELEDLNYFIYCQFNNLLNNIGGNLCTKY